MLSYKYFVTVCGNTQSKFLPRFLYARIPLQSHVTVSIIRNSCVPIGVPSRYVEKTSQDMRLPLLTIASTGVCPTTWSSSRDLYILPAWYCGRYQMPSPKGDHDSCEIPCSTRYLCIRFCCLCFILSRMARILFYIPINPSISDSNKGWWFKAFSNGLSDNLPPNIYRNWPVEAGMS